MTLNGLLLTILLVLLAICVGLLVMLVGAAFPMIQESNQPPEVIPDPTGSVYGCPGCPSNFMDFANDMCTRPAFAGATVSDGVNTISCSEITRGR